MTRLQVKTTPEAAIVRLHDELEIARMHMTSDAQGKRRLHLEVSDTGEETLEMVLAIFKYAKAMGDIPLVG